MFKADPRLPSAFIFLIIAAIIMGQLLYKTKLPFNVASLIGAVMLIIALWLGAKIPDLIECGSEHELQNVAPCDGGVHYYCLLYSSLGAVAAAGLSELLSPGRRLSDRWDRLPDRIYPD